MKRNLYLLVALLCIAAPAHAAEQQVTSPDGKIAIVVSDVGGLHYRVSLDGKPVVVDSRLGLEFQDGTTLGQNATIGNMVTGNRRKGAWVNRFGTRRVVPDQWREIRLSLRQAGGTERTFGLIVRAYDDGVAFRYDLPESSGLGNFVLAKEDTEFRFGGDYRCWYGEESVCAENHYPESTLSQIPSVTPDRNRAGQPFRSVLPLLVETPNGYVAVAESDLRDWAGMFVTGTGSTAVNVTLASRMDGKGLVVSTAPRVSPWRVLMIGSRPADLMVSNLIPLLATPNQLGNVDWVKPGVAAWDSWWTGVNPTVPQFTGLAARGDTRSHEEYIDFAAEMGWRYKVIDWMWYRGDPTKGL